MNLVRLNCLLQRVDCVANYPSEPELEDFLFDMDPIDQDDAGRTWRKNWLEEMYATFENSDVLIRVANTHHTGSALFGINKIGRDLSQAWLLQSSSFAEGARQEYGKVWPIKMAKTASFVKGMMQEDHTNLFNFIPRDRSMNIRLLKYCRFTFYNDPRRASDMLCFASGPQSEQIGTSVALWNDFLG